MNQISWFNSYFDSIQNMLTVDGGVFISTGQSLCHWFAILAIALFGVKVMIAAERGEAISFVEFGKLAMFLSLVYMAVTFYLTPIPGVGDSFTGMVTHTTSWMSHSIASSNSGLLITRVDAFRASLEVPFIGNIYGLLCYGTIWVIVSVLEVGAFVVIGWGFLALAVCVLIGPMMIPFLILPKLDWLFWGWFKCFIQYAMFQVVAAATMWVIGETLMPNLQALGPSVSITQLAADVTGLMIMFGIGIFAIFEIPRLTSHIFSGSAGSGHGMFIGLASRWI
jgi:hypothetical protein